MDFADTWRCLPSETCSYFNFNGVASEEVMDVSLGPGPSQLCPPSALPVDPRNWWKHVTGDFLLTGSFSKWARWKPPFSSYETQNRGHFRIFQKADVTKNRGWWLLVTHTYFTINWDETPEARSVSPYRLVQARPVSPLPPQVEPVCLKSFLGMLCSHAWVKFI